MRTYSNQFCLYVMSDRVINFNYREKKTDRDVERVERVNMYSEYGLMQLDEDCKTTAKIAARAARFAKESMILQLSSIFSFSATYSFDHESNYMIFPYFQISLNLLQLAREKIALQ